MTRSEPDISTPRVDDRLSSSSLPHQGQLVSSATDTAAARRCRWCCYSSVILSSHTLVPPSSAERVICGQVMLLACLSLCRRPSFLSVPLFILLCVLLLAELHARQGIVIEPHPVVSHPSFRATTRGTHETNSSDHQAAVDQLTPVDPIASTALHQSASQSSVVEAHPPNATLTHYRFTCSFLVGDLGDDAVSQCVPVNDTASAAALRQRGDVDVNSTMQANTGDPRKLGGLFHVVHSTTPTGGDIIVTHENCKADQLEATASSRSIRDYIAHRFGPTSLQLFTVGPELHSWRLVHVTALSGQEVHPCQWRAHYLVHTSGMYQLHLEWMYSSYHFFLEGQPLWPRGLYGELLGPAIVPLQFIVASPILIPAPVEYSDSYHELPPMERWGPTRFMQLPESFPRFDPGLGLDPFRQPQGLGRWMRRSQFSLNESFPSYIFWPRKTYREELGVSDVHSVLKPFRDCYFADIDE